MNEKPSTLRRLDESGVPLLLARLVLGGVFIFLGAKKLGDPVEFLKQIRMFHLLPEEPPVFLNSVAIILPWLEIFTGSALILGTRVRAAASLIVLMLAVFTPAILMRALAIRAESGTPFLDIKFDCGCGTGPVIIWKKLLTNAGLFALAIFGVLSRARRFGDPPTAAVTPPEASRKVKAPRHEAAAKLEPDRGPRPTPVSTPNLSTP